MVRKSSARSNLVIKVQHGDTLRRFGACVHGQSMDIDMAKLKAKIITLFKFKPDAQMLLTYDDEDGDIITLDSDNELYDAAIMQRLNPLRINVQLISEPLLGAVARIFDQLSKVAPEVTSESAALKDLSTNEKPEHANQPILNDQVKEMGNKQSEDVDNVYATQNEDFNEDHERGLGGQCEEKGKSVIDDDDVPVPPPLADPSADKQSQNSGSAPVENELRNNGNKIHSCDNCGTHPIRGPRFESNLKEDQVLCGSCFAEIDNKTDYTRINRAKSHSPRQSKESFSHLPCHRRAVCGVTPFKMKLSSSFIQDVTIHDGTIMPPNSPFTKIWRMRNNGTIAWPYGTRLVWIGGDKLETQDSINLEIPATGYPVNEELDIAVDFLSPSRPDLYVSYWRMASPSGEIFGDHVWIMIKVDDSEPSSGGPSQSHTNLNVPPEKSGDNGVGIVDVNCEPKKEAASVKGLGNDDVPMQKSEPDSGVDNRDDLITQPVADLTASSCGESAAVPVGSTLEGNCLEQTLLEGLEKKKLEEQEMRQAKGQEASDG